ncbi:MAG: Gfo/Idh/MocA family oxidoreductase [Gammaproteobacteria bacterium]|nr:Gfo/Idh/MocA family oxidoreductase [Gammaproteobacteria bacterium]MXY57884.1 Gfo/Idh/MocA family oxidoreductase [Gammaproteobacteria bacterium]MYF28556.1 Gfo/Idh/MocA family oxidoreductase [Gammaproteobacteria bacterium]MYK45932.1 Gfo/Idh/MocA family oxidoreductase [Gammaproteobacteria bacterium]
MSSDNLPPSTPLDVRRGVTDAPAVAHPLRWGILGAGSISAQWVESLHACKGASVTAVAAREMTRAQAFANALNIPSAYDSYVEMATADDVDIVYVGTITRLHKEHSLIAIEAGKHVLCEKPLAENVDDAREMYAAAEAKGVMLQDAMWTRFFPAVEHARFAIETGVIGDVSLVQSDFFDPIYTIQAAPLAFGADAEITNVTAAGLRRGGAAIVEYGDRGCAVLTFPPFNCELGEVTEIAGTKGRIMLGQPGHCPTNVTIRIPPQGGVPSRYRTRNAASPEERFDYPLPGNVAMARAFPNQHGFLYQAEAVHRCLDAGLSECPQYGKAESLHAMDLLTRIQRARHA